MATALDVAKYLIQLASSGSEPDPLTHLRLQKLLYYAQGWSLAQRNKPLFTERIEAWANGPVVRVVYPAFADCGFEAIDPKRGGPGDLTEEERAFVRDVWEAYKGYSATALREMTHGEAPWKDARGDLGPADKSRCEIPRSAMKHFFTSKAGS